MRKSRYSETTIVRILKEVEGGRMVKEVCREYGISDATYYNWKSKYGGMEASDIKRLKELEDENRRLKQMFADLSLENRALKDIVEKSSKAVRETGSRRLCEGNPWFESSGGMQNIELEPDILSVSTRHTAGFTGY
jgi:putative transposase